MITIGSRKKVNQIFGKNDGRWLPKLSPLHSTPLPLILENSGQIYIVRQIYDNVTKYGRFTTDLQ